jgi:hypothetical protein
MTQRKKIVMSLFRDVFPGTKFTLSEKAGSSVYVRDTPRNRRVKRNAHCVSGLSRGQKRFFKSRQIVFVLEEEHQRVIKGIEKKVNSGHFSRTRPSH